MPQRFPFHLISLLSLLAFTLIIFASPTRIAFAATFTVDDPGDATDFNASDNVCDTNDSVGDGPCTLRAAIGQANGASGADIINFSISGTINTASALSISTNMTINGAGVTVDNTGMGRVFSIANSTVVLSGLTITGGSASGSGSLTDGGGIFGYFFANITLQGGAQVTGNDASGNGSGIAVVDTTQLTLTGSGTTVTANFGATNGAGIYAAANADVFILNGASVTNHTDATTVGSGVFVTGTGTTLTVDGVGTTISGNTNANNGGGIYAFDTATVTVQNGATVTGNDATSAGSGITATERAQVTITGSGSAVTANLGANSGSGIAAGSGADVFILNGASVSNHTGATTNGGGIYLTDSGTTLRVNNATVSGNTGATNGGGVYSRMNAVITLQSGAVITGNTATGDGGGIYLASGTGPLSVTAARITYNTAGGNGDAIFQGGGSTTLSNACIVCNGDNAISRSSGSISLGGNWWGSAWGPYYSTSTSGLQCSTSDSLNPATLLTTYGITVTTPNTSPTCGGAAPIGNWLTAATAGCTGSEISAVSSIGHARTCSPP